MSKLVLIASNCRIMKNFVIFQHLALINTYGFKSRYLEIYFLYIIITISVFFLSFIFSFIRFLNTFQILDLKALEKIELFRSTFLNFQSSLKRKNLEDYIALSKNLLSSSLLSSEFSFFLSPKYHSKSIGSKEE